MALTGALFIGSQRKVAPSLFRAVNPATGLDLAGEFSEATPEDVHAACELAAEAYRALTATSREDRAEFLDSVADNIMDLGGSLIDRAAEETGLPLARLTGERGRTVNQLRLFAAEVRDGAWMGIRIDPAIPAREPVPRPDLRMCRKPIGPVAVFGASNFPLAFSVAGGDTASALAAGCPVVVKAHGAHPGTSEIVASAIADAVSAHNLHEGTFSMLHGPGHLIGQALISHPAIRAVGFTGSRKGGVSIMKTAASREVPIPVYAEMSAVNPVILLPGALHESATDLARGFVESLTLGAGQFCTNPGLIFAIASPGLEQFIQEAGNIIAQTPAQTMLTAGIHKAYENSRAALASSDKVSIIAEGIAGEGVCAGTPELFLIDSAAMLSDRTISEEVFGATSVIVQCPDERALIDALKSLDGQLTTSLHFSDPDMAMAQRLLPCLEELSGRIIANGWPTGVEVCHAMTHGGPFPATSDTRTTSVGTLAIERFLRPVSYQDFPATLLPAGLAGDGPDGVLRRLDGNWVL